MAFMIMDICLCRYWLVRPEVENAMGVCSHDDTTSVQSFHKEVCSQDDTTNVQSFHSMWSIAAKML